MSTDVNLATLFQKLYLTRKRYATKKVCSSVNPSVEFGQSLTNLLAERLLRSQDRRPKEM